MEALESICNNQLFLAGQINIICMIIPVIAGLIRFSVLNRILRIFFLFCVFVLSINLIELAYVFAVENYTDYFLKWLTLTDGALNFLSVLYHLNDFVLLGLFFSLILEPFGYKKQVLYTSLTLGVLAVIAYILEAGWRNYDTFGLTLDAIFTFTIPLFYLWHLVNQSLGKHLMDNPYFLISLGLILPNLIGLFLFFTGQSIREQDFCLFARLAIIKNVFSIIGLILFAIGFWKAKPASFTIEEKA